MSQVIELLEDRGIFYKLSGRDVLVACLNPEHEDRSPSMRIDKVLGVFHCFSCGYKGNLFAHYDVDYSTTAVKREQINRIIANLRSAGVGLQLPEQAMPYIGNYRGIKPETYKKFGAFRHHVSPFSGRINFPITDTSGRVVAFQGRDDTDTLPNTYMFHPSGAKLPLFPNVRPLQGRVILVEGIFDMLNLHDNGLENAICCFGVKNFSETKLNFLKISGVQGLDIMFDGDHAGKEGAEQVRKIAGNFPTKIVKLPNDRDPGSLDSKYIETLRKNLYG